MNLSLFYYRWGVRIMTCQYLFVKVPNRFGMTFKIPTLEWRTVITISTWMWKANCNHYQSLPPPPFSLWLWALALCPRLVKINLDLSKSLYILMFTSPNFNKMPIRASSGLGQCHRLPPPPQNDRGHYYNVYLSVHSCSCGESDFYLCQSRAY